MLLPAHRSPLQKPLRGAGLLPTNPYLALYQRAVVLYSLRKTTPQATHAIRIRRDSDSVEQDIGFLGKDLNQQAIKDFGGYNLFQHTEDFTNNYWRKDRLSILSDQIVGSSGHIIDVNKLTATNSSGTHQITVNLPFDFIAGNYYTISFYAKASSATELSMSFRSNWFASFANPVFNLADGTKTQDVGQLSSNIEELGNGCYRCSITGFCDVTGSSPSDIFVYLVKNGNLNFAADGTESIFLWGAQLTKTQEIKKYQPRLQGGASDCTIVRWYDQINNNDSVQNNIALQPKIYDVESGEVTKENGKPAGILDGVEDNIPILNVAGRSNIDAYFVNRHYLGNTIYPFGTNSIVGDTYGFVVQQNSSSTLITSNYGNPNLYKNKVLFAGTTRNNIYNFLGQTQNIVNHQGVNVSSWDTFHFGNFPSNQFRFEGTLQEIIVFADNLTTAERQILHDDINNYYAIY
jgi:hypothetical protein